MMTTDWTAGYVTDVDYTHGYYIEMNPLRLHLACIAAGVRPPRIESACELGYGQGLSINMHAAAGPTTWWGTDFNPAQAGFAQELQDAAGSTAHVFDESFAEFAARDDLPTFDCIALHGIWSWIADEDQDVIVDFIRRRLNVGGVLYVSYNTLPGWAAAMPLRHLMKRHNDVMGCDGSGTVQRVEDSIRFAKELFGANPAYARANPNVAQRLDKLETQNKHYLAHEYFNRNWQCHHFGEMADTLEAAKLNYGCSAHLLDLVDAVNLTPDQQKFMQSQPDRLFRETVRDYMVNQQFRRDIWVRGLRRLTPLEQAEAWRAMRFVLVTPREDVSLKVTTALGEVSLKEEIYGPILDLLADHQPRTVAQIEKEMQSNQLNFGQVVQAVTVLAGTGALVPVQDNAVAAKASKQTAKLNAHLCDMARSSTAVNYLASPLTGGGVNVGRFEQLFLLARTRNQKQPADWARFTWDILAAQGQRLLKDGATIEKPEDNLAELTTQAEAFASKRLPVLKALQIA